MKFAKYVNRECNETAMRYCPQFSGYDNGQLIELKAGCVKFGKLPKHGLLAVVKFWTDKNQTGGRILFENGYAKLPIEVRDVFKKYKKAKKRALKNVRL